MFRSEAHVAHVGTREISERPTLGAASARWWARSLRTGPTLRTLKPVILDEWRTWRTLESQESGEFGAHVPTLRTSLAVQAWKFESRELCAERRAQRAHVGLDFSGLALRSRIRAFTKRGVPQQPVNETL
jgi:hypothetical protein